MAERCLSTRAEEVVIVQQLAPLYLDRERGVFVPQDLVNQLADHQLAGVRFMYQQVRSEYTGLFLNDEPGLGKCHQVVALLRAVANDPATRSMVLCSSRERAHYWAYHLELLVVDGPVRSRILVKTHQELAQSTTDASCWHYIVVDETNRFATRVELAKLRSIKVERFIFLCSINLLNHPTELSDRLPFCCEPTRAASLSKLFDKQQTKRDRFRAYLCLRPLLLRRYTCNYQRVLPMVVKEEFQRRFNAWSTPADGRLTGKSDKSCPVAATAPHSEAATLKKEDTNDSPLFAFGSFEMTPQADNATEATKPAMDRQPDEIDRETSKSATVGTVQATFSEPLFEPFEMDTEQMPALRVESGSSTDGSVMGSQQTVIGVPVSTVPETLDADSEEFLQLGQGSISCSNTHQDHQPVTDVEEDRYCFPMDKFQQPACSSSSAASVVEQSIPNGQKPASGTDVVVITSSSSSSDARAKRLKSPSLFGDSDNDTASLESDCDAEISITDMLVKSPGNLLPPSTSKRSSEDRQRAVPLPRTLTHCSTPIAKLITAPLPLATIGCDVGPSQELNLSSADIFADSPAFGQRQRTRLAENVFEITKNAAFPNRIVVQENDATGGLPGTPVLRIEGDLSDDDDDDVVEIIEASEGVIDLVDDESDACKTKALEGQRTPQSSTSNSSIRRTGSGAGGLNRTPSSSGWLGKRTPTSSISPNSSNSNTPTRGKPSPHLGGSDGNRRRIGDRFSGREPSKRRRKLDEEFQESERSRTQARATGLRGRDLLKGNERKGRK
ncbi:uncharacterized protein LOC126574969 [Anopheles aquasalis]|uniref:uncharacterized protein LOC126574969 n=1 Tax=Anopheles aquasalis TaxID=42839 RepID=UPI00215B1DD1|nr:uncharacterized protein LOC126574969 [Anopheles aquasalis]